MARCTQVPLLRFAWARSQHSPNHKRCILTGYDATCVPTELRRMSVHSFPSAIPLIFQTSKPGCRLFRHFLDNGISSGKQPFNYRAAKDCSHVRAQQ